jgi:hypothetical protein
MNIIFKMEFGPTADQLRVCQNQNHKERDNTIHWGLKKDIVGKQQQMPLVFGLQQTVYREMPHVLNMRQDVSVQMGQI